MRANNNNQRVLDELNETVRHFFFLLLEAIRTANSTTDNSNHTTLLTAKEVAERLRISEKTVYRDARSGKLPCVRIGRRVLFNEEEIDKRYRIVT